MVRVATHKVEKSYTYDVGKNVIRLDKKKRNELGVNIGDPVIVRSNISVITANVKAAMKHDIGKNILKLDRKQRQMLGVDNGSTVNVINYIDYKQEEKKLKPQPLLMKENLPTKIEIKKSIVQLAEGEKIVQNMDLPSNFQNNRDQIKKKSFIDMINSPATIAAFIGFLSIEIGTYFYPINYNHIVSVFIAIFVFVIVAIFNKR